MITLEFSEKGDKKMKRAKWKGEAKSQIKILKYHQIKFLNIPQIH